MLRVHLTPVVGTSQALSPCPCVRSQTLSCVISRSLWGCYCFISRCVDLGSTYVAILPCSLCVKVSVLRMKACRSDEHQRLTTNFHQSSCRQGEGGWGTEASGGAFSSSEDLPLLIRLPGSLCVEIWSCSLLRFHNFYSMKYAAVYSSLYHCGEIGNCSNHNNIFICNAVLSDDGYMPTFIPLSVFFALLPSVRILNMACIDFFFLLHQLKVILWALE